MTRADFYIGTGPDARWIGSINHDGYPDGVIPCDIFTQVNEVMFEELVVEFLQKERENGNWAAIASEGDEWPWPWNDSRTTDYAYMLEPELGKVVASHFGEEFFDPIIVRQGEDLDTANLQMGSPRFPAMTLRVKDGSRLTATL